MKSFNINNMVTVKLSECGAQYINNRNKSYNQFFKEKQLNDIVTLKEDYKGGDIYKSQMWELISDFEMTNGVESPFLNCEIYFNDDDLKSVQGDVRVTKELEVLKCSDKCEDNDIERNVNCLLHNIENGHFIKCEECDTNWHKGCMCCIEHLRNSEDINIVKQALIQSERDKRFKKIILEKGVDMVTFNTFQTVIEYNWSIRFELYKRKELTEEEFNFLKEMSNNE